MINEEGIGTGGKLKEVDSPRRTQNQAKIDEESLGDVAKADKSDKHSSNARGNRSKMGGANNRKAQLLRDSNQLREEGNNLMRAGHMDKAIKPLEKGLNLLKDSLPLEDDKAEANNEGAFRIPICQDLCLCYSKIGLWRKAMEVATDGLELCGPAGSEIKEINSDAEQDNRRTSFLVRRGVACSNLGPEYYQMAESDFLEVIQGDPRHRDAKRGMQYLKFLKGQLNTMKKFEKKTVVVNPNEINIGAGGRVSSMHLRGSEIADQDLYTEWKTKGHV